MTEASDVPFGLEVTKALIAKFLLAIIGFVGTIVFARILGSTSFGGFYLLWSIVMIAKLPVDGFAEASKKRFSESEQNRNKIVGASILVTICILAIIALGALIIRSQLADYTGLDDSYVLFILILSTISLFAPFQSMIAATGQVSLTIWIDFLRSLLTTPLQLGFVLLNYGAAGMAYGLSLATILTIPVTHYTLRTPPLFPDRATLRELWSYARHSIVSTVLGRTYSRFDILLLGLLLTPSAAAEYEVALKLTLPAVLFAQVTSEGLMARVSNLHNKGADVASSLSDSLSFTSIISLPLFFGGLVLAHPLIVTIYGSDYAAAAPLLIGLALYRVVRTQSLPLVQTVNGIDRPELNVRVSLVTLIINIILGVGLTLQFGAIGVVIATVVAESLRYILLVIVIKKHIPKTDLFPYTLFEQFVASVLMAVIVVVTHQYVSISSWIEMGALVGVGAVTYTVTVIAISDQLRETVDSVLKDANFFKKQS